MVPVAKSRAAGVRVHVPSLVVVQVTPSVAPPTASDQAKAVVWDAAEAAPVRAKVSRPAATPVPAMTDRGGEGQAMADTGGGGTTCCVDG